MSDTSRRPLRLGRLGAAIGGLLMAAFFLALTALILAAPRDDGPVLMWISLCAFIVLMFGGLALTGLYPAFALLHERWLRRRLRPLDGRCLGCGGQRGGPAPCVRCGHPAGERDAHWTVTRSARYAPVLGFGFGGAVVALGVFMACLTVASGGLLTGIVGGLFALLLLVAGVACSAGSIMALRRERPPAARLCYERAWPRGNTTANTRVEVTFGRDGPTASGLTTFTLPLEIDPLDSPLVSASGSEEGLASAPPVEGGGTMALASALAAASRFERALMALISAWEYEGWIFAVLERSIEWTWPPATRAGDAQRGPAYRSAAPPDDDDGVERVERDGWYLKLNGRGLARLITDGGFDGDLQAITALDEHWVEVRALARAARASEALQGWVEGWDRGADAMRNEIPAHIFRAVRASA